MGFFKRKGQSVNGRETTAPVPMFTGRPQYTGSWVPGVVTHPLDRRHWVPNRFGIEAASSTVKEGQWSRGQLLRFVTPPLSPTLVGFYMHDPTSVELTPATGH